MSLQRNSPEDAGRRTKQVKGKGFARLSGKETRKSRPEEYALSKKAFSPTIGRLNAQNPSMSDPLISTTIVYNQEAKERQCEYSGGLVQSDDDYS